MEHSTGHTSADQMIKQMQVIKFGATFKAAMDLFRKNPAMLVLVFAFPLLINGALEQWIFPQIIGGLSRGGFFAILIWSILQMLISAAISFFGLGALVRATQNVSEGKAVNVGEIFAFVQKHFVDGVKLAIKLFIFTGAWFILAYIIVMTGLLTAGLYGGRAMAGLAGLGGLMGMLLIFVIIGWVFIYFKKLVNSTFSYIYFFTSDHPQVEESLQKSLKNCEGLTMTIFGNYILLTLVMALAGAVIGAILSPIFVSLGMGAASMDTAAGLGKSAGILVAVIGALVGTFGFTFQYTMKEQIEKFRGHGAGSSAHGHEHAAHSHQGSHHGHSH